MLHVGLKSKISSTLKKGEEISDVTKNKGFTDSWDGIAYYYILR
jgi:hypothetical protein